MQSHQLLSFTFHKSAQLYRWSIPGVLILLLVLTLGGTVLPTAAHPTAEVDACGSIAANTTWTSGNLYVANNCAVTIEPGVTLTVQSGTVVKFSGGQAVLIVKGTLSAQGTLAQPLAFTSKHDNTHGAVASGSTGIPAAQDWYGVHFMPGSTGQISHAFIGYSTAGAYQSLLGWNKAQIYVEDAALQLDHVELAYGIKPAIYLHGVSTNLALTSSHIHHHASSDINNPATPVYQSNINIQTTFNDLVLENNDRNHVRISNSTAMDRNISLAGTDFGFACGSNVCPVRVTNGYTMTLGAGSTFDMINGYRIYFNVEDGGTLLAEGTPTQPITITKGTVELLQGSKARLAHCDIGHSPNYLGLKIASGDVQLSDCTIHDHFYDGISIEVPTGMQYEYEFKNLTITDNGEEGIQFSHATGSSLNFSLDGALIADNGRSGVYVTNFAGRGNVYVGLKDVTIQGNGGASGYWADQVGLRVQDSNINLMLENVAIVDSVGQAMNWGCNGSLTLHGITGSGNGTDAIIAPGCAVDTGRQWDFSATDLQVRFTSIASINAGGFVSIVEGSELFFTQDAYIYVNQGSLYALGTPNKPIQFGPAAPGQGAWLGLRNYMGTLILQHCDVGYAGNFNNNAIMVFGTGAQTIIQNCAIHHSGYDGIGSDKPATVIRYNNITNNTNLGVKRTGGSALLDARHNYWGHATGPYHATLNPGGLGDKVGDNVLFDPWLTEPAEDETITTGQMLVTTGSPQRVSPGQGVDYAIQYLNLLTETVQNGVLVMQLPQAAIYQGSTGGGIYWPERDQVFWELGDIPTGTGGFVSAQVTFEWGLPADYQDSSITIFAADNYYPEDLNLAEYAAYNPVEVVQVTLLTPQQVSDALVADPALQAAYDAALAAGFTFHSAGSVTRSDGQAVTEFVMVDAARKAARLLARAGNGMLVYTITGTEVVIENATGGMRLSLLTGEQTVWGDWDITDGRASFSDGCTPEACRKNCRWQLLSVTYIKKKVGSVVAWTAFAIFTGGGGIPGAVWEIGSTVYDYQKCDVDCGIQPGKYCCTAGQVRYTSSFWARLVGNSCFKETCNAITGTWSPEGAVPCVAFGYRCVSGINDGGGCKPCDERISREVDGSVLASGIREIVYAQPMVLVPMAGEQVSSVCDVRAGEKPRCKDLELVRAKDPNAISGPLGDVLPSQLLTYTVTYENEGDGIAFGVYVINTLPEWLDEGTLNLSGQGIYMPTTREIFWFIGELAPKGNPLAEGARQYTVRVRADAPVGVLIANEAVVYFPSVPEETPTNTWVNMVGTVVAIPQQVETSTETPVGITLGGNQVGDLPLTFAVIEGPRGGELSGIPPALTYTPFPNFIGEDAFTFQVGTTPYDRNGGTVTSRPAQVRILVTPEGDLTPPQIIWVSPAQNTEDVAFSTAPIYMDETGGVYAPIVAIGLSEPINPETLTTSTIYLEQIGGGLQIAATVAFDALLNQALLMPRVPLKGETNYRVIVYTGLQDLAGNPLASEFTWIFTTEEGESFRLYLPLVLR